jgi:hypothetical protein
MRINVYSQEIITDGNKGPIIELVKQVSNTGIVYSAVRLFLHSSERLHHPPADDDRSAITFWLPKSNERRQRLANEFELLAQMVRNAPVETGLD